VHRVIEKLYQSSFSGFPAPQQCARALQTGVRRCAL